MSTQESPTQPWMSTNSPAFADVQTHLTRIGEQNLLHEYFVESGKFQTPEYVEAVHARLADEQQHTLAAANEAYVQAPSDEALSRWDAAERRLAQIALDEAEIAPDETLRREAAEIVERMPDMKSAIDEIAAKLETDRQSGLRQKLADERIQLEAAREAYSTLFPAWPLPRAIAYRPMGGRAEDVFPDAKVETSHTTLEDLKKHFHDKMFVGASEALAILFAMEPGNIYTREEIAEILYNHDSRTPEQRKSCVAALISNHETNRVQIIATELSKEGLVLQRGRRTIKDPSGKTVKARIPIFRAIPFDAQNATETVVHPINGDHAHDGSWEDKRAKLLQSERSVTELSNNKDQGELLAPASATEKQFIIDLNKIRKLVLEAGLLNAEYVDETGIWSSVLTLHGEQYASVRTLKRSTAWKNVITRQASDSLSDEGLVKVEYALLLSFYDTYSNYLKKSCHVTRAAEFVRQQLNSWRQTSAEVGRLALMPSSKAS